MFIKKYLKWISTFLVLTGILLTNLNIYPINIYFHGLGVVGWTIAGFISKDKAILTNFGLQIPLFIVGIYKVIFYFLLQSVLIFFHNHFLYSLECFQDKY